jgi:hypothetical protein
MPQIITRYCDPWRKHKLTTNYSCIGSLLVKRLLLSLLKFLLTEQMQEQGGDHISRSWVTTLDTTCLALSIIFLKCCCSVLLLFACTVVDLMAQYSAEYLLFIFYVTISHLLYLCTFNSTMYKITIFNSTDYRLGCEVLHIRLQNNVKKTCMGWKLW